MLDIVSWFLLFCFTSSVPGTRLLSKYHYPPSLKLHDATLADQQITTQYDTKPRIDFKSFSWEDGDLWGIRSPCSFSLAYTEWPNERQLSYHPRLFIHSTIAMPHIY